MISTTKYLVKLSHSKFWNLFLVFLISEDLFYRLSSSGSSLTLAKRVKGPIPLKFLELEEVQDMTGMEEIIRSMKERRSVAAGITALEVK